MSKDRDDLLAQADAIVAHWTGATGEEIVDIPEEFGQVALVAEQFLCMVESGKWAKAVATVNGKENP